jgi:large subunit ribosomal protein L29
MKTTELRKLETAALTKKSVELREEIVELRRRISSGDATNLRAVRNKRKDLARVLTVLTEQLAKENA